MSEAEYRVCRNCCLTLGGLKAGSLFACAERCRRPVRECLCSFRGQGIRFAEMDGGGGKRLFFVYDRFMLEKLLSDRDTARFLTALGYDCSRPSAVVAELAARVRGGAEFPHEIGVFLGYALDDVKAFIADPGGGTLMGGYWKVYSGFPEKRKLFDEYRRYSDSVFGKFASGQPLAALFQ